MIKIIVAGAKGRMGSRIKALASANPDFTVVGEVDRDDSLEKLIGLADVVIDFTVADAAALHSSIAAKYGRPIVIGTTGLNKDEQKMIEEASHTVAIVKSPNMSVGVNVMWKATEIAAKALGREYKVDIVETHHVHKLDKPSGTAKKILDIVLKESGRKLDSDVFFYEESNPAAKENDAEISVRSIRRGEVAGDHVVHFTSSGETLSIEHHAASRDIFAQGALVAANWVIGKPAGLYGMNDVLGL